LADAVEVFLQKTQLRLAAVGLINQRQPYVKSAAEVYAGEEPLRVVVVGEHGMAMMGEYLKRYRVCGGTPGFHGIANFPLQIAGEFLQSAEGIR